MTSLSPELPPLTFLECTAIGNPPGYTCRVALKDRPELEVSNCSTWQEAIRRAMALAEARERLHKLVEQRMSENVPLKESL